MDMNLTFKIKVGTLIESGTYIENRDYMEPGCLCKAMFSIKGIWNINGRFGILKKLDKLFVFKKKDRMVVIKFD